MITNLFFTKKKPIIELRTAYIYELIKKKPYPPKEIPFTEKAVILIECTEIALGTVSINPPPLAATKTLQGRKNIPKSLNLNIF